MAVKLRTQGSRQHLVEMGQKNYKGDGIVHFLFLFIEAGAIFL